MSLSDHYEGKAKILFSLKRFRETHPQVRVSDQVPENAWVQHFKDDLTAFDATKKDKRVGKGALNQQVSQALLTFVEHCGFKTHYISTLDVTHQAIHRLEMIPLECVVRRVATGSLVKRLGIKEGKKFSPPLFEIFLKNDALHDPLLMREHASALHPEIGPSLIRKLELLSVNLFGHLSALFEQCQLELIDGKFEFGFLGQHVVLGDEITPDTLRIWKEGRRLDKDVFRHDLGDVMTGYQEILKRLQAQDVVAVAKRLVQQGVPISPYTVICEVLPQEEVLDPEGQAIFDVLQQAQVKGLEQVKLGKRIALSFNRFLNGYDLDHLERLGSQLLANPLIEQWQFYLDRT